MKLTLDGLRVLDAIDRLGSFAAAADELHRVTSAVSYSVSKMETDLGVRLFDKQGKRSVLTEAGKVLVEQGRHLLKAALDIEQRTQRIATGWESELHVALDTLLPVQAITGIIDEFQHMDCGTELHLHTEVLGGSWDALVTGRCDLAIGAEGSMPSGGGIQTRPLTRFDMAFVVAPSHPLVNEPQPLSEEVISRHPAVVIADSSRSLLPRTTNVLERQQRLVVPDIETRLHCQAAGLGVGSIPRPLAEVEQAAGRLVIIPTDPPSEAVELSLAWRSRDVGQALQWFIDAIEQADIDWAAAYGAGVRP